MIEHIQTQEVKKSTVEEKLEKILVQYLGAEATELLKGLDHEHDQFACVVGILLELGEDPDEVLREFGLDEEDA